VPGEIVDVLQFAIDGVSTSQNTIANNLANAQTPDFTASATNFQASLDKALSAGGPATATTTTAPTTAAPGTNGNNVSMADELLAAEKATLQFQTVSESINAQFRLISGASGGSFQ
jgi:flagellar basal-body rod protein FlgB